MGAKIPPTLTVAQKNWQSAFTALAAADQPTITVATSTQVTGDLISPTASMYDDHFRFDGCLDVVQPAANYVWASTSPVGINYYCNQEFVTVDGSDTLEIPVYVPSAGLDIGVRVIVDGLMSHVELQRFSSTPSTVHYIKIVFPSSRVRHLIVEIESVNRVGGVKVPTGHTVERPSHEIERPIGILADSFGRGAGYSTGGASGLETFAYYVARACKADRIINFAIGGTGWVNAGSNDVFGSRVPEILTSGVAALIAAGSRNDSGSVSSVYAAAFSALDSLSPIPYIAVGGPAQAAYSSVNAKVKDAAIRAGRPFIDVLDIITDDLEWTDGIHPSHAGHIALGYAFCNGIDHDVLSARFEAEVAARIAIDLTLTVSPTSPVVPSTSVTFTATQSAAYAGEVAFIVDGVEVERATVTAGVATYTTSALTTADHTVIARFIPQSVTVRSAASNTLSYSVVASLGFSDDFNRADEAIGSPWVTSGNGSWTVTSNKLANTTIASGTGYCVQDAGTANGTLQFTVSGTLGNGLLAVMRYQSVNNMLKISYNSGAPTLYKTVGGSSTVIAACTGGAWAANDVIEVICSGTTITVKKNGSTVLTQTGVTDFSDKTFFGVGAVSAGTAGRFDDVSFVA